MIVYLVLYQQPYSYDVEVVGVFGSFRIAEIKSKKLYDHYVENGTWNLCESVADKEWYLSLTNEEGREETIPDGVFLSIYAKELNACGDE